MTFTLAHQIVADFEADACRNAAGRMACHEQIVGTFVGVGVTHQPTLGTDGVELLVATGDEFVWIDLVTGIPDQAIKAEVIGKMQRQAEFDDTQVARKVSGARGQYPHQFVTDFLSQLFEFHLVQTMQISRGFYFGEQQAHENLSRKSSQTV